MIFHKSLATMLTIYASSPCCYHCCWHTVYILVVLCCDFVDIQPHYKYKLLISILTPPKTLVSHGSPKTVAERVAGITWKQNICNGNGG